MLWPNADAGNEFISKEIRVFREKYAPSWLYLFKNLPVEVYLQLLYLCKCLVGNSSSAVREGEFIGVKAVNIGSRQNARLRGKNLIDCGYSEESIKQAISQQISNKSGLKSEYLYGSGNSANSFFTLSTSSWSLFSAFIDIKLVDHNVSPSKTPCFIS